MTFAAVKTEPRVAIFQGRCLSAREGYASQERAMADSITMLIVDDQHDFCDLLREMLLDSRFQIIGEAHDGVEAMSTLDQSQPDLILVDVEMPRIDGLRLTRQVLARFPKTPVVLMSAYHESEYVQQARRTGALDFIPKGEMSPGRLLEAWRKREGGSSR